MTIMHLAINVIFALQLALLSGWLPHRCQQQHPLQPNKPLLRVYFKWINRLVLLAGSALLLAQLSGWIALNISLLLGFTSLQVFLLLVQRQWLQPPPIVPTQRKASLQPRRVLDYVQPADRVMAVCAVLTVPLLAAILVISGNWAPDMAKLWRLITVGLLTNTALCAAVYFTVFRKRRNFDDTPELQQLQTQRKVNHYLKAIIGFNLLLVLFLLLGAFQAKPELLYIVLSLSLQLMLLQTRQRPSADSLAY
ncbi:hypothetical protein [Arsukibacterium sp. UBA3155]|uniref:hypothetical protein n=1 Tax=Arsukibacterium sp. UBA3155 TaxID=1946058 RepID=UPI0025BFE71E|nr:hypothetical protein [Arsukibacterium sp. UBA3155]|tara:strand:- start:57667 stop:58419 length:753 start_codon:yes stop_codon:yes gene_type:complete